MNITNLTPRQQLHAGRMPLRMVNLYSGLTLYALAEALIIRANLGVDPWGVFHLGLAAMANLSVGTIVILVGAVVLLGWIPLRQWPGLGTVSNAIWIGLAMDMFLSVIPVMHHLPAQIAMLIAAVVLCGLAGALYIGSHFGPGPRDGLMTGIHLRTGLSIRAVRTTLELSVLGIGWMLGGPVGVGTVVYALLIGPMTQFFFRYVTVKLPERAPAAAVSG
ncbi:MAG TPA: hypothetical protein VFJ15_08200 [Oleiagrimonas sp.]|nr:hypothetical protein [Oleiagrimonas sp.]